MESEAPVNTLQQALARHAHTDPRRAAIISEAGIIDYGELAARARLVAAGLLATCGEPGARVVVATRDKARFLVDLLGVATAGFVPVPFSGPDSELRSISSDCQAAVVLAGVDLIERASALDITCPCIGGETLERMASVERSAEHPRQEQIGMLVYTSGTTSGERRGVMQTYGLLDSTARYMIEFQELTHEARELVIPPLHHAFGLGRCRVLIHAGATIVLQNGAFNPAAACLALEKHECNAISGVSTNFALLLDRFERFFAPICAQLRWAEVGSVVMSHRHRSRLVELMPHAKIMFNYGLTEAMRTTLLDFADDPGKLDTFGRPAPGNSIRVLDEHGRIASPGAVGRITVAGKNLAAGYWGNPDRWQSKLVGGYFDTGDLGFLDHDGYLNLAGRADDVVNVGGEKVHPDQIELALRASYPDQAFTVLGLADPQGQLGEIVCVCFEGGAPSLSSIQVSLRGLVTDAQLPRRVVSVSTIPRTANGKVLRSRLRHQIEGDDGRTDLPD